MSNGSNLTAEELRVLAALIEKSHTTPDQYPLSSNALTNACNQKSSRDPVVDYTVQQVDGTLQLLRDAGWVRMIRAKGNRTFKHRHVIDEKLGLSTPQQAVMAVLALRGAQSPGELKTRTERYHPFAELAEVEKVLASLRDRETPLTRNVGRASGQSQDRWIQLIGPHDTAAPPGPSPAPVAAVVEAERDLTSTRASGAEVRTPLIECIGGFDWSDELLEQLSDSGLDVVQASVSTGESFRDFVRGVERWNLRFRDNDSLVGRAETADDVRAAMADGRTSVVLASPDPSPIEDDIGLVEICHMLGLRLMALSDGRRSSLIGIPGAADDGLSTFGRQAVAEMNRVGLVAELGHCGDRSALEVIEASARPTVIAACRPSWAMASTAPNSHEVIEALTTAGGLVRLALQPPRGGGVELKDVAEFTELVAEAAERYGVDHLAIGSGASEGPLDETVAVDDGRQAMDAVVDALSGLGFLDSEIEAVTGGNWLQFYEVSFGPE